MGLFDWLTGRDADPAAEPAGADEPAVAPVPTVEDLATSLDEVRTMLTEGNAPPVVTSRVLRIAATIEATLPRLEQIGMGSADGYSVMATATDYLPEAVGGYLRLPRDWADTRPVDGAKTSLMVLIDQLEILAATTAKIFDAANRQDAQALVAHGRFLQARFGHAASGGGLDLGQTGAGPVPPAPDQDHSIRLSPPAGTP